jgi:hypothetical protein
LQQGPWEDFCFRNVVPGRGAAAVPVKFRRCLAEVRPGRVGERSRGPKGSVWGLNWRIGAAGVGAPRHRRAASAWSAPPASSRPGQQGGGPARLQWSREARLGRWRLRKNNRGHEVAAAGATRRRRRAHGRADRGRFVGGEKVCLHCDKTRGTSTQCAVRERPWSARAQGSPPRTGGPSAARTGGAGH